MLQLKKVEISCDLVIQLGHVGYVILYPEPQLGIASAIDTILFQLLTERFVLVYPAKIFRFRLVLESKVRYLNNQEEYNVIIVCIFIYIRRHNTNGHKYSSGTSRQQL